MNVDRDKAQAIGRLADKPTQIPPKGWFHIFKRAFAQVSSTEVSLKCAGVAFFAFLSLFPVLACFVLIYGIFADASSLTSQMEALRTIAPAAVYTIVRERLEALLTQPEVGLGIGLLVSFVIALWSGSRGTNALIATIGGVYYEDDDRGFLKAAALSLGLTLGAIVLLITALLAIAVLPIIFGFLSFPQMLEDIALMSRWPLLAILVTCGIAVLYRMAPNRRDAEWKWVIPGAMLAGVLWIILSLLFSLYVEQFSNYSATFGSLSVAVVLMLWIYYSSMVIAAGAAFNAEIEHQTSKDTTVGPDAPLGSRGAYVADHLPEKN